MGGSRASQVPNTSLITCHALRPRQSFQNLTISIPLFWLPVFRHRRQLLHLFYRGCIALGRYVFLAAYNVPCVRFTCLVHLLSGSATGATLGTGCWLGFTRLGLPVQEARTSHPIRSAKLCLAHQKLIFRHDSNGFFVH